MAASRSRSAFDRSVIARDVAGQALVHPVRDLLRAKRLLAEAGEEGREACGVEIEEVGHVSAIGPRPRCESP